MSESFALAPNISSLVSNSWKNLLHWASPAIITGSVRRTMEMCRLKSSCRADSAKSEEDSWKKGEGHFVKVTLHLGHRSLNLCRRGLTFLLGLKDKAHLLNITCGSLEANTNANFCFKIHRSVQWKGNVQHLSWVQWKCVSVSVMSDYLWSHGL